MKVLCPKCLEETTVRVDVTDWNTLTCVGCEEEYSVESVRQLVDAWSKLLPRLEAAAV